MRQFLEGNVSPLTGEDRLPPDEDVNAAGYGFYISGIMEKLAQMPYDELIEGDYVWVGTPDEVAERIQGVIDICPGVTEVSILCNMGGIEHWKAIKAQELFADTVMPHFKSADRETASVA